MDHFLICKNPNCRFVMDILIGGKTPARQQFVLSSCPECGSAWSTSCPFSGSTLVVQWLRGLPHCLCCSQRLLAKAVKAA